MVIWRFEYWTCLWPRFEKLDSSYFKSASLFRICNFLCIPLSLEDGIWGENAKHVFRPERTRSKRIHSAARPLQKRAHLEKQKELFLWDVRALSENWFLSARTYNEWHIRNFWGISHTYCTWMRFFSLSLSRLFGEMKTVKPKVSDGHSFVIAFHAHTHSEKTRRRAYIRIVVNVICAKEDLACSASTSSNLELRCSLRIVICSDCVCAHAVMEGF